MPRGGSQTCTINPQCYENIADVQADGVSVGAVSSYTFTNVTASHTITATFAPHYTITASAGAGGTISQSGWQCTNGSSLSKTFTIVPNSCYTILDVVVDGTTHYGASSSYTFTNVRANHTIAASFLPNVSTSLATGTSPHSVAVEDINADGWPDLAVANSVAQTVSVLLGDGMGGFGAKTDFPAGGEPASVAIGDVSGDGKPDLAVANGSSGSVSVLLGTGGGGFAPKTDYYVAGNAQSVAIGDLNGDGRLDLAVANFFSGFTCDNTVSVLLGNGNGTFGARTDFGAAGCPSSVAIADLNGDGRPDLAVTNPFSNTVSVLLGDGAGGFGAATNFPAGSYPNSVAIGTLNSDGNADLAVANLNSNTVSVLLGTGGGGFAPKTDYNVSGNPQSVAIGDVNGDGKSDLVATNSVSNTVSVWIGNGSGTFGVRQDFCTGDTPVSVAVADLNGDGWLDLATANANANTVSVLLNSFAAPVAVEPSLTRLPREFELFAARPNPANGSATFAFALPEAERVRVEVFDIAGRQVAQLWNDEVLQRGPHALVWDGRGSCGARVTSGVYLVRVSAGQRSATGKLVMVSR